jgi:hypothetical protein
MRCAQALSSRCRQIASRDLPFEPRGEQSLLPRPRDRAVIGSPPELLLSRGIGERGIRNE